MAKKELKELTHAELDVMQILWEKKKALVREVLDEMPEPKPAYNTVSTVVRVLEKKGFVSHKALERPTSIFRWCERRNTRRGSWTM